MYIDLSKKTQPGNLMAESGSRGSIHLQQISNNSSFQFNRFNKGSSDRFAPKATFILMLENVFDAIIDNFDVIGNFANFSLLEVIKKQV